MINRVVQVLLLVVSLSATADNLLVTNAWIKNLPPVVPMRAGYMSLSNQGNREIRIVSVESEAFSRIEMHESVDNNGMMSMREIRAISVKAGETLHLQPGGVHLMMMEPLQALAPGDQMAITLVFNNQSTKSVLMEVRK